MRRRACFCSLDPGRPLGPRNGSAAGALNPRRERRTRMIVGLSHRLLTALVAAGFAAAAALAAPAAAQVADDGQDQVEVTEETLRAFAAATLALMDVRTRTAARLA